MGDNLPPLTEKIGSGPEGGLEFERLMHQLFFRNAEQNSYFYEVAGLLGGDYFGVDGLIREGDFPGLEGPAGIQFKWLWDHLHKNRKKRKQIEESLQRAEKNFKKMKHWILVTPKDLTKTEKEWFDKLGKERSFQVHHFGQQKIEQMLRSCPSLLARYYPEASHELSSLSESFDFKKLLMQYKDKIVIDYKELRLFGIPHKNLKEQNKKGEILLKDIFVPLNLTPWREKEVIESASISELLKDTKPKVVLGDPGSGKSTLLHFISLLYSGGAALKDARAPSQIVPLFISVREYIRFLKDDPRISFIDYLVVKARKDYCLQHIHLYFFESLLLMGEAVVLFDGLDEVYKETSRARISRAIEAFHNQYPNCPIWITSRIVGYSGNVKLSKKNFDHFVAARFDESQICRFVENWYTVQIPHNKKERIERAESLKRAIQKNRGVKRLSSNPLLLTLMALIHRYEATLPQDRGELYDKCVEMLLKTWQAVRDEESGQMNPLVELGIIPTQQKNLLARLALWMQKRNENQKEEEARGLAPEKEVLEQLTEYRVEFTREEIDRPTAKDQMQIFLDYIRSRTGLLVERGEGQFAFFHLSFQEYLAAYQLLEDRTLTLKDHLEFFIKYMDKEPWEEVLLLLLYGLSKTTGQVKFVDMFASTILRHLEEHEEPSWWLMLGRAIRDNLDFTQRDCRKIIEELVFYWMEEPTFEGKWFQILDDISIFSDRGRSILMRLLEELRKGDKPKHVITALHMTENLFWWPEGCSRDIGENSSFDKMIPDLFAFIDHEEITELLHKKAPLNEWVDYETHRERFATCGKILDDIFMDNHEKIYTSMLLTLWNKIFEDISKRNLFASKLSRYDHPLLIKRGTLEVSVPMTSVRLPLSTFFVNPFLEMLPRKNEFEDRIICRELFHQKLVRRSETSSIFIDCSEKWSRNLIASLIVEFFSIDWRWERRRPPSKSKRIEYVSNTDFGRYFGRKFLKYFDRKFTYYLSESFIAHFGTSFLFRLRFCFDYSSFRHLVGELDENFVMGFYKKFDSEIGEDFSIELGIKFGSEFGKEFSMNLGKEYGVEFGRKFGVEFGRRFQEEYFQGSSARKFGRILKKIFITSSEVTPKEILRLYESPELWYEILPKNMNFIPIVNEKNHSNHFAITSGLSPMKYRFVSVANPYAIPFALFLLSATINTTHLFLLTRNYIAEKKEFSSDLSIIIDRNHTRIWLVALSWNYIADLFFLKQKKLSNIKKSAFLSYAAYVTLCTGIELTGESWHKLLESIDHTDPLLQVSYLLYEICNFRNIKENSQELVELLESMKHDYEELLESGGLLHEGEIAVRFKD